MRILRNYILKEFLLPLGFSLLVMTFVMLLGNLVKVADLIINKGVDIFSVSKIFLYMIPALLTYTMPISTLVATLLSLGVLSSNNEILTIKASGINMIKVAFPLLVTGLILSIVLLFFNDRVVPWAHYASRKTLIDVGMKNPTAALEPGVFINSFDRYILFIYGIENNKLNNVRIYEPQPDNKPTRIIVAKRGEFIVMPESKVLKLKLIDGTADEPDPDNPNNFYKLNFKNYYMSLSLSSLKEKEKIDKKPKDMNIAELRQEATKLSQDGIDPIPLITEINKKLALACSCIIFVLLGIPLAVITHRREKTINFGISFLIVGVYYLLLLGAEALCIQGYILPQLGMWAPNIIFTGIGSWLTYRICAY